MCVAEARSALCPCAVLTSADRPRGRARAGIPYTSVLEGVVIVRKNPNATHEAEEAAAQADSKGEW